ncbi:MAG: hypothetical protein KatS3mg131_3250 [Candidatus Tectimicrobiota bacterium]|nr:MAG: hypothetical protein KatS3mg131_3250 [Candidatus Tectomicrobia bacterium]
MSDEFGVTHGFDVYLKLWQCWPTLPAPPPPNWRLRAAVVKRLNRLYSRYVFSWRNRARHVTRHIRRLLARAPEPFFLYAIYWDMHLPYYPRRQDAERWLPAGMTYRQAQRVNRNHLRYLTGQVAMDEEDFAVLRALYDGALAAVDAEIGALVAWLRRQGLLERTLLIITSDHGENLGDHGLMSHAYSLHDTLIRVPLLIRYPPCFPAGTRFPAQVQLTDLFPTVLDVVGLDVPHVRQALQGLSLLEADAAAWAARPAYAEMLAPHPSIRALNRRAGLPEDTPRPEFDRALRCVRLPDVKLVWASDGRHALYDLRQDPHETQNRFHQEPELAAALLDLLARWQPTTPRFPRANPARS